MAAFGHSPDGTPWRVGLPHPRDPMRTLKVITLKDEAVSTCGDFKQFFVVNGRRYPHVLHPRTGYPANQTVAATVIAPSAFLAEALSTSLFILILGPERAAQMAHQYPAVRWYLTDPLN